MRIHKQTNITFWIQHFSVRTHTYTHQFHSITSHRIASTTISKRVLLNFILFMNIEDAWFSICFPITFSLLLYHFLLSVFLVYKYYFGLCCMSCIDEEAFSNQINSQSYQPIDVHRHMHRASNAHLWMNEENIQTQRAKQWLKLYQNQC